MKSIYKNICSLLFVATCIHADQEPLGVVDPEANIITGGSIVTDEAIIDPSPVLDGSSQKEQLQMAEIKANDDHLMEITGPILAKKKQKLPQGFIDYTQDGKNWPQSCLDSEEQSPVNLNWEEAEPNEYMHFDLLYNNTMNNATVSIEGEKTTIKINYPNQQDNDIRVWNERKEDQTYHLSHMIWKVPAEHTINDRQLSAELQIFHIQYATDRQVALSMLFDKELSLVSDAKSLKTCFFEAFDFLKATDASTNIIDVPLKEFINFMPQNKFAYYYGSETQPDCQESVTWLVNMEPSVITEEQIEQLNALLDEDTVATGGNSRNIQQLYDRTIYRFDNKGDWARPVEKVEESKSAAVVTTIIQSSVALAATALIALF